jgi:hypothetical protein
MSAFGRLWRRAPVWRVSLVCAIVSTALAAMFPPAIPRWAADRVGAAGADLAPKFVPQTAAVDPAHGIELPPLGTGRSGIIPFAGRQLPLPAGAWQELVLAKSGAGMAVQAVLLGRIDGQRLTGLMMATAPGPFGNAAGEVAGLGPCDSRGSIAHQIVPADMDRDPLSRECWVLVPLDTGAADSPAKTNDVLSRGLGRLQAMGVAVPGLMLGMDYVRSDPTGWMTVLVLLPDSQPSASRRVQAWVRRFAPLLHKGFDGGLKADDVTPGAVRDPE